MQPTNPSSAMFHASHRLAAADGVVCAANPGAQVSKRTRIWAGGLSTVGGEFPE